MSEVKHNVTVYRIGFRCEKNGSVNHLWDGGEMVHIHDYDALATQLAQARRWFHHRKDCAKEDPHVQITTTTDLHGGAFTENQSGGVYLDSGDRPCTCGLNAFLKELDHE